MTSFSIVTIVYNDFSHILETMHSVINQSYKHIQYILVDGWSTDGSREKILNFISHCAKIELLQEENQSLYLEATHKEYPTLSFRFLSQKDQGIYDAMNKGISLAQREWINFMNCGDRFYDQEVLEKVALQEISHYDVIYGNTEVCYSDQNLNLIKIAPKDLNKSLQKFGVNLIHQSMFFKTVLHQNYLYNTQEYKLASDYDLVCRLFFQKFTFAPLPFVVSVFHTGGSSDLHGVLRTQESLRIAKEYAPPTLRLYFYYLLALSKKVIKLYCPTLTKKLLNLQK